MDSRNENFTSWEWLICRIIPKEIVTPLLDMLENTENPCAIPIKTASSLLMSLVSFLEKFSDINEYSTNEESYRQ